MREQYEPREVYEPRKVFALQEPVETLACAADLSVGEGGGPGDGWRCPEREGEE